MEDFLSGNKLEINEDNHLFPFHIFLKLSNQDEKLAGEKQKIIIGCWEILIKQSKQFINLLKWGSVEELENIAGSSDNNKHPEPPYNFSKFYGNILLM